MELVFNLQQNHENICTNPLISPLQHFCPRNSSLFGSVSLNSVCYYVHKFSVSYDDQGVASKQCTKFFNKLKAMCVCYWQTCLKFMHPVEDVHQIFHRRILEFR